MATVIARYATGYLRTTVLDDGDGGYVWVRRPGPDRLSGFGRPCTAVRAALTRASTGPVLLALPDAGSSWPASVAAVYRVDGPSSLAALLQQDDGTPSTATSMLTGLGTALGHLHGQVSPPEQRLPPPAAARRLAGWLRHADGPRAAARLHRHTASTLGRRRLSAVESWCADLLTAGSAADGVGRVPLHGAPSTASLVPARHHSGMGHLLIGEDLAVGPAEFDVGWPVGELVELRERAARRGDASAAERHGALIDAFLSGYPRRVAGAAVGRVAALRFLTHLHDFAAYVGWHDTLPADLTTVADVIDAAWLGALLTGE